MASDGCVGVFLFLPDCGFWGRECPRGACGLGGFQTGDSHDGRETIARTIFPEENVSEVLASKTGV